MSSDIPLPYNVIHRAYMGAGEDAHGNEIPTYAAPIEVPSFWWSPSSTEPALAGHDRVLVDLVLVVDSALTITPRDLFDVDGNEYSVIGYPQDYDHGPWWSPGVQPVNLRRVEG
ncbi:hypothetical protein IU501_10900 [Nocardia otitidiscaviarum]|uniref:hypothetical protein n=1 Tax=Nocardia otitidiscaviarum TaxID=1823 RepID=UPI001893167D|nr:hypothetical protein [Nocardia otitidiscaviarum]MBF6133507.1 hypothetical protein [Nocardia otitidiscaviarum]